MGAETVVFLVTLAFLVLIGLPTIRNSVTLPAKLEVEEVASKQLAKPLDEHFSALDAEMRDLGFGPLLTFKVTNLGSDNMLRLYLHTGGRTFALGTCLAQNTPDGRVGHSYVEFIDEFEDGCSLTSRNSEILPVFAADPRKRVQELPAASPGHLWKHHRDAAMRHSSPARSWQTAREIMERGNRSHEEMCEFQVACGRLSYDPGSGRFQATYKLAILGLVNFLNPFADNFTWTRFLLTLGIAGIIPAWGLSQLPGMLAPLLQKNWTPEMLETLQFAARAGLYGVAGMVIGLSFPGKTFIWSFLITYVPPLFLPGAGLGGFLYALWAGLVADRVSALCLAKRDLFRSTIAEEGKTR